MSFMTELVIVLIALWIVMGCIATQLLTMRGMQKMDAFVNGMTAWPVLFKQEYEEMKRMEAIERKWSE